MKLKDLLKFLVALGLCQGAGIAGSPVTAPAIPGWYASLQKPSFSPPNWLFAPVWATLFTLMALAAYQVWSRGLEHPQVRHALTAFLAQLVLNVFWSYLFFGLRSPGYALLEIFVLWAMILVTMLRFFKVSRIAGLLLLPYLLWVGFACGLNFGIVLLNP